MVTKKEEIKQTGSTAKFRYYCHGCTKNAAYTEKAEAGKTVVCPHCGLSQVTKPENYIAL